MLLADYPESNWRSRLAWASRMTAAELVAGILRREGGYRNVPGDKGGPTNFGITAGTWGAYQRLGRVATEAEIKALSLEQATDYYLAELARSPFAALTYEPLRVALFDFGVNSGQERAIRWLQRSLGLPATSTLDAATQAQIRSMPGRVVTNAVAAARAHMILGAVEDGTIPVSDMVGLLRRAISLAELTPDS